MSDERIQSREIRRAASQYDTGGDELPFLATGTTGYIKTNQPVNAPIGCSHFAYVLNLSGAVLMHFGGQGVFIPEIAGCSDVSGKTDISGKTNINWQSFRMIIRRLVSIYRETAING
jgi:hypothetical protein